MKNIFIILLALIPFVLYSQEDPLRDQVGNNINTTQQWEQERRPEILELFRQEVYGKIPDTPGLETDYFLRDYSEHALGDMAKRKQVTVRLRNKKKKEEVSFDILIYYPVSAEGPVPVFLGMNFYGNHTIHPDPAIFISESWVRNNEELHISENKADEKSRGVRVNRWPVEYIVSRGYGIATIYYGDLDPDYDDGNKNGLHALLGPGDNKPAKDEAGSIAVWAHGLSEALNYFATDPDIDQERVAVIGHSRLGKTSLWAGANDPRFALVISNNSGCGGAALSIRKEGETVKAINTTFPHWFAGNFRKYNNNEEALPVDQHMLISLIAPRPVYVASAQEDLWADPKGEYLALYHAGSVYRLYGLETLHSPEMPAVNYPQKYLHTGYHIRNGKHDITPYDWEQYLDFADFHFKME